MKPRLKVLSLALAFIFTASLAIKSVANEAVNTPTNTLTNALTSAPTEKALINKGSASSPAVVPRTVNEWLLRMNEASKLRTYTGTYVVSVGADMASAKIWHVCDGDQQIERVETLTGVPRSIFRHNSDVVTFFPNTKLALKEQRESLGIFPNLLNSNSAMLAAVYDLKVLKPERVAGLDADVVLLAAKDRYRYSYRIWTERKTGLVVKLQTLDVVGRVLEQAAFSELNLNAPVKMGQLANMMRSTAGHKVQQISLTKTTASAQGWVLAKEMPGFTSVSCYKRALQSAPAANLNKEHAKNELEKPQVNASSDTMQWMFSDGLANVSLFAEPYDSKRHVQEGMLSQGATNTLTKRKADWWLTAVGEVPFPTLSAFLQQLERKH